jgi:hypothetical protein
VLQDPGVPERIVAALLPVLAPPARIVAALLSVLAPPARTPRARLRRATLVLFRPAALVLVAGLVAFSHRCPLSSARRRMQEEGLQPVDAGAALRHSRPASTADAIATAKHTATMAHSNEPLP